MLKINSVSLVCDHCDLLNDITLELRENELYTIIGPEGSGKTSLAQLIAGNPNLTQISGSIMLKRKNITKLDSEERSKLGIFVTSQRPPTIDGVTNLQLIKEILKVSGDTRSLTEIEKDYKSYASMLGLGSSHGMKIINDHSSLIGDSLKNELLQMLMIDPLVAVLDSIDDQVDQNDLDIIAEVITAFIAKKDKMCLLLTNNKSLMEKIKSTTISVLVGGEICATGDGELYKRIIDDDYSQLL